MKNIDESFLEIITENARYTGTWTSAFRVAIPCIPLIAAFISVLCSLFLQAISHFAINSSIWLFFPLLAGTTFAGLFWILLASIVLHMTTVDTANATSYNILCQHLTLLDNSIMIVCDDAQAAHYHTLDLLQRLKRKAVLGNVAPSAQAINQHLPLTLPVPLPLTSSDDLLRAKILLIAYRDAIYTGLMQKTDAWTIGTGYTKLWSLMDKAEEIMICVEAPEIVVQVAIYDDMCLRQSNIDNNEEWISKLRAAVAIISTNATPYLSLFSNSSARPIALPVSSTMQLQSNSPGNEPQPLADASTPPLENQSADNSGMFGEVNQHIDTISLQPSLDSLKQAQARAILQLVHRIIVNFKARNWNSIINARHQLLHTMTFVSLTTYVALEMTIVMQMNAHHLMSIFILGLTGALSGLFGRLYHESQADNEVNDYHLGTARLMVIPLLSGLAAIIGVLIVAKGTNLDDLSTTKSMLSNFPLAAVFGLTPNLVLNQLQQKSEKYIGNIRSTRPTIGE